MSDQFNQLLLQTLKEVGVRLERLEGRVDHVINEKPISRILAMLSRMLAVLSHSLTDFRRR